MVEKRCDPRLMKAGGPHGEASYGIVLGMQKARHLAKSLPMGIRTYIVVVFTSLLVNTLCSWLSRLIDKEDSLH